MRNDPSSISTTWPPEERLGSCLTNTRSLSGSRTSNHDLHREHCDKILSSEQPRRLLHLAQRARPEGASPMLIGEHATRCVACCPEHPIHEKDGEGVFFVRYGSLSRGN